jgi:hypothetical protein
MRWEMLLCNTEPSYPICEAIVGLESRIWEVLFLDDPGTLRAVRPSRCSSALRCLVHCYSVHEERSNGKRAIDRQSRRRAA